MTVRSASETPHQPGGPRGGAPSDADGRARAARGTPPLAWWRRGRSARIKLTALVVVAIIWELVVALFGQEFMATPSGVLAAIPEVLFRDEIVWGAAWETLRLVLSGLVVAVVVGGLLGLVMGRLRWVRAALGPYVNGVYATPMIAVLPVLTLWLGFGVSATFALIVYAALPPMTVAAWDGTISLPARYLEVARTFRASRRHIWVGVALPSSLPNLIAGFRLASGRALSAVVIAEFLIGTGNGLGIHVMRLAGTFRHDEALVAVLILGLTGLALTVGLERLIARFLPWYREL